VAEVLRKIPGAADGIPSRSRAAPYLDVKVDREAAARYGVTVGAIQDVIETAIGEDQSHPDYRRPAAVPRAGPVCPGVPVEPEALASVPRHGSGRRASAAWTGRAVSARSADPP